MAQAPRKYSIADALGLGGTQRRNLTQGYRQAVNRPAPRTTGTLKAARPTAAEELAQLLTPDSRFGAELAAKIAPAVDMSPLGLLTGLVDARRQYQAGNTGQAAGLGILAALGAIPGGKGASSVPKELLENFVAPGIEPIVTQAGRAGIKLADPALLRMQHPSGYSPFSSVKPKTPVEEFQFTKTDLGTLPSGKIIDPQSLQNAMLVSLYGDKTDALKAVTNFGGIDVNVPLNAGPRFGAMQQALGGKAAWASEKAPVGLLRDRIAEGLNQGRDVYGIYTAMGPQAGDQTVDMANLIVQAAKGSKIKKADIQKFDKAMKKIAPKFPGLMDEDAMRFLETQTQGVRKKMIELLDTAAFQNAGLPNIGAARVAITDENLLNAPAGSSGYSIVKFSPDTLLPMEPVIPHPSYGEQMAGEYVGQFKDLVPFDLVFKDLIKQRRAEGLPAGSDLRSVELKKPNQIVDQETIDGIMSYLMRLEGQGQ